MISINSSGFKLNNIQGVLLDKDGTITDSHIYWSELILIRSRLILKKYSLNEEYFDKIATSMGLNVNTRRLMPKGPIAIKSRNEVVENIIDLLSQISVNAYKEEILEIFNQANTSFKVNAENFIKPINHAIQFILKLKNSGIKISLVTSDTTNNAINAMEVLNIKNNFDYIIGGDSCLGKKATGEPAIFACKKMSLEPKYVIAIGDAEMDFKMAKNALLMSSILVATGQNDLDELRKINPMSINNLDELKIS